MARLKFILVSVATLLFSIGAGAQTDNAADESYLFTVDNAEEAMFGDAARSVKDTSYTFNPHAYIQFLDGANFTYGPIKQFTSLISPQIYIAVGANFKPEFGIRGGIQYAQGRGYYDTHCDTFKYFELLFDVNTNLSNLIGGYRHDRVCSVIPFIGIGGILGHENDIANNAEYMEKIQGFAWKAPHCFFAGRAGIELDFRCTDRFSVNLELNTQFTSDKFNSIKDHSLDGQLAALIGIKYRLTPASYSSEDRVAAVAASGAAIAAAAEAMTKGREISSGKVNYNIIDDEAALDPDYPGYASLTTTQKREVEKQLAKNGVKFPADWGSMSAKARNQWLRDNVYNRQIAAAQAAAAEKRARELAAAEAARLEAERKAAEEAARIAAEKAAAAAAAAEAAALAEAARRLELAKEGSFVDNDAIRAALADCLLSRNIFFIINRTDIRDTEEGKMKELLDCLKEHPNAKITIIGNADKTTGNYAINWRLGQGRANIVRSTLNKRGIDMKRMKVVYKGDTDNLFDTPEENRVSICIIR